MQSTVLLGTVLLLQARNARSQSLEADRWLAGGPSRSSLLMRLETMSWATGLDDVVGHNASQQLAERLVDELGHNVVDQSSFQNELLMKFVDDVGGQSSSLKRCRGPKA